MKVPFWKYRLRRLLRPETIENQGVRIHLGEMARTSSAKSIYAGKHEQDERKVIRKNLRPDDIVLEIGAGLGIVTIECCQIVGSDRVHSFEANSALEPLLRKNFELNKVTPSLTMSLVSMDGKPQDFFVADKFVVSSRFALEDGSEFSGRVEKKQLPSRSLATLLKELKPTFLVMDIEGSEVDLVEPSLDLSSIQRACIEVHPNIVGDAAIAKLVSSLDQRGLTLCLSQSRNQVLYFARNPPAVAKVA